MDDVDPAVAKADAICAAADQKESTLRPDGIDWIRDGFLAELVGTSSPLRRPES